MDDDRQIGDVRELKVSDKEDFHTTISDSSIHAHPDGGELLNSSHSCSGKSVRGHAQESRDSNQQPTDYWRNSLHR